MSMYIKQLTESPGRLKGLEPKVLEAIQSGGDRVTLRHISDTADLSLQAAYLGVKRLVNRGVLEIVYTA